MLPLSEKFDLAALLDAADPAEATANIAARLETLGAEDKARLRRDVVASLQTFFRSGTGARADWFEPLLDTPALHGPEGGFDPAAPDVTGLEKPLCDLLVMSLDAMAVEDRARRIADTARHVPDISLLCALVSTIEQDPTLSWVGDAMPKLREILLQRIGDLAATAARFWTQRFPAALLWFWFVHGEEQRVYLFTRAAMDDPRALLALLTIPIERAGPEPAPQDVVAVRRWSRILDFQALEARAVAFAMSAPARDDRRRARRFLEAFATGKSELFR